MKIEKFSAGAKMERPIWIYELRNDNDISVRITNYGCIIMSIVTAGRSGERKNIVAGFDTVEDYFSNPFYFGCIVGRCANRTAGAAIRIDGITSHLSANAGKDHLHGGIAGLDQKIWNVEYAGPGSGPAPDSIRLVFSYRSPDKEEGYPGDLDILTEYSLDNDNQLTIRYKAVSDKTTPVNLTNHTYFNLSGFEATTVLDHCLHINAEKYTPTGPDLIPTGEIITVAGSALDFRQVARIGARVDAVQAQSYDHNFVLDNTSGRPGLAAEAEDPASGRKIQVWTDQPCMQFYTSGYLDGTLTGAQGKKYLRRGAFCLETQQYPDAANQPGFPTSLVPAGAEFSATTIFRFLTT